MGDAGSQVLGFALAALGLTASWKVAGTTVATLLLPILILAVPILDTTLVTVVRLLEGRPVYQGGRDHTSHRLVYHGLSEKRAVTLLAVIAAGLGATSLAYNVLGNGRITTVGVLVTFALLVQFGSYLSEAERGATPPTEGNFLVRTFLVNSRRLVEVVVDFALVSAAFLAAYLLRVEGSGTINQRSLFLVSLPIVLAARYAAFIPFGLYRGVWRYAGARDAAGVVAAVGLSELVAFGFLSSTRSWGDFPRSIFVIDVLLCTVLVGASRFAERAVARGLSSLTKRGVRRRTLIVGAGRGGRSLLRELRETPGEQVVGFVDDDGRLRRRRLQGVPVVGGTDELERILERTTPDAVLVTIPDAPRELLDRVIDVCLAAEVPCRFVRRETDLDPQVVLGAAVE
jgi:UDP-GlcNAc:undecaprenyl-phosphate GlcNAc-1-phosphate transferase